LIVVSFALVYAFFTAPLIPPNETVKPPISQTETREERPYSCQLKRNKFSYEVLSSQFDLDKNELITKVKVTWNGYGQPPEQIYIKTELFTLDQKKSVKSLDPIKFSGMFENRREATLIVISKTGKENNFDERQNLYSKLQVTESFPFNNYSNADKNLEEANQVLIVHERKLD
jgi:hypothetical protein